MRVGLQENGAEAVLTFSDSGTGISREDLPRIFDRFYRVDPARSAKPSGIGLGLAISKAIVDAHRGTITCQSVPREGSTFTVRLPRRFVGVAGSPRPSEDKTASAPPHSSPD